MDLGLNGYVHTYTHGHGCAHTDYKGENQVALKIHTSRAENGSCFLTSPLPLSVFMAYPGSQVADRHLKGFPPLPRPGPTFIEPYSLSNPLGFSMVLSALSPLGKSCDGPMQQFLGGGVGG